MTARDADRPADEELPAEIQRAAEPVLERLPEKLRDDMSRLMELVVEQTTKFHSGPLPDPDTLERYGRLIDNGCERLMQLVEQEAKHRHIQEDRIVLTNAKLALRGQWFSGVLVVVLTGIATFLTVKGFPQVGGVIFATTVAAVAALFIYGRSRQRSDNGNEPSSPKQD